LFTLLAVPVPSWAAPPKLTGATPLGAQRGKTQRVIVRGSELASHPRLIAPFAFRLEESGGSATDATSWEVRLTVADQTAVGVYPIRIATDEGFSNPILFAVCQVPQMAEIEANDTFDRAQSIPSPVVVEGACSGNDEDFFRFHGRRGDRIVVDALCARMGSGVDPMIRLTTASWRFVASADDTPGLFTDAYLSAVLPEDGDYVLELCDSRFAGTGPAGYRLLIGAVPYAAEIFPLSLPRGQNVAIELRGGTLSADQIFALRVPSDPSIAMLCPRIPARLLGDVAWPNSDLDVELPLPVLLSDATDLLEPADPALKLPALAAPATILGRLSKAGERDEYTITAQPGSRLEARVEAWGIGSALDGELRAFDARGRSLGQADDGKGAPRRRGGGAGRRARGRFSADPALDLTMPAGQSELRLVVKDLMDRGGVGYTYRLAVRPAETLFQLALSGEPVAIPRGGTALLPVTVTRGGFRGAITLAARGVPKSGGITVVPGIVPPGQDFGVLGLAAAPDCRLPVQDIQIVGSCENGPAVVASTTINFAYQTISNPGFGMGGTIASYARPFVSQAVSVTRPGPISLTPPADQIMLAQGATAEVFMDVARPAKGNTTFKLAALAPPPGLTVAETSITQSAARVPIKIAAARNAPLGRVTVAVVAQDFAQGRVERTRQESEAAPADGARSALPRAAAAAIIALEVVAPKNAS
jgi:hypothetical protein